MSDEGDRLFLQTRALIFNYKINWRSNFKTYYNGSHPMVIAFPQSK